MKDDLTQILNGAESAPCFDEWTGCLDASAVYLFGFKESTFFFYRSIHQPKLHTLTISLE